MMDTKTGTIYPTLSEAERDLHERIVAGLNHTHQPVKRVEQRVQARLITGPKPTLRKLQHMIRKQLRHEAERKQKGEGARDGR